MQTTLKSRADFREIFAVSVSRIMMIKLLDSCMYTEFDDEDLIRAFLDDLRGLDGRMIHKPLFPKRVLGGGRGAKIISGAGEYNFSLRENRLWFNDGLFLLKNDMARFFDEIYDLSVERHSKKTFPVR